MHSGWFEWNGVRCTDYGIVVSELPDITLPEERVTFTDVPGRNGSLTILEGDCVYKDMTLTAQCWVKDAKNLPAISSYLRGAGTVRFANRPEGTYRARITNQIPLAQIVRGKAHRSFALNFRCKPFLYLDASNRIEITESGYTLTNPGNVFAEPVITVYPKGIGDVVLTIAGQSVTLVNIGRAISMDSETETAYSNITPMLQYMSGEFIRLPEGRSTVTWTGSVEKIEIEPRWRCM